MYRGLHGILSLWRFVALFQGQPLNNLESVKQEINLNSL